MPIELYDLHYKSRDFLLKVINLSFDFGKMHCMFFEREIDNIFRINSSKLKKKPLVGQCVFKDIKKDIFFNTKDYYAPSLNIKSRVIKKQDQNYNTKDDNKNIGFIVDEFSANNYYMNDDDDDEVILSEISITDYLLKFVNKKDSEDFLIVWKCFLDKIRNINNLIRIKLESAGVDVFVTSEMNSVKGYRAHAINFIPPLVDYIYFGQTKSMTALKHYLITYTCDYNLTVNHINQFSHEIYNTIGFVPVNNVEKVYQEILKIIDSCSEVHAKKIHGKIFYLTDDLFVNIYKFVESNRTNKEFE